MNASQCHSRTTLTSMKATYHLHNLLRGLVNIVVRRYVDREKKKKQPSHPLVSVAELWTQWKIERSRLKFASVPISKRKDDFFSPQNVEKRWLFLLLHFYRVISGWFCAKMCWGIACRTWTLSSGDVKNENEQKCGHLTFCLFMFLVKWEWGTFFFFTNPHKSENVVK